MKAPAVSAESSIWFVSPRPNNNAKLRLFCFPYAGGSSHIFNPWLGRLPPHIEMVGICLPGHGRRFGEPALSDLEPAMEALVPLFPFDKPFAFFGHSMGAIVSFELSRRIRERYGLEPEHLFVSSCFAPHEPDPHPIHQLEEAEFIRELRSLNGMPREVLDSDELMELVLPILRADFTLTERYKYNESAPLRCPITAFGGHADTFATRVNLEAWQRHTSGAFELRMFEGDHFYLHTAQAELLTFLSSRLQAVLNNIRISAGNAKANEQRVACAS